jgi:PPOX class probable F420-dependent enzyme
VPKLSDTQARLFVGANIGTIATLRPDGSPHVTPVWVDWDGEHVLVNTASAVKQAHLRRDPRATVTVFDQFEPIRYVEVSGTVELSEERAWEHADLLARRHGRAGMPRRSDQHRVLIRVRPERVSAQGC